MKAITEHFLYCDIETVPDEVRLQTFRDQPPQRPGSHIPSLSPVRFVGRTVAEIENDCRQGLIAEQFISEAIDLERAGKNRSGVLKALESNGKLLDDYRASVDAFNKKLSLTPEKCRIRAIGMAIGDGDIDVIVCNTWDDESAALKVFWARWEIARQIVGYNFRSFDACVLLVRSVMLGVKPERKLDLNRYRGDIVDLMDVRFGQTGNKALGLKEMAACYGLHVETPDVDGSIVAEMSDTEVVAYCRSDVSLTRQLHGRFQGVFC